jgi:hypothetical protein
MQVSRECPQASAHSAALVSKGRSDTVKMSQKADTGDMANNDAW